MSAKIGTTPRKKAIQERAQGTIDAILRATAHILVTDGYDRASTNRIAARAGVSIGSLHQYFPSKESLVAALMEQHMETMAAVARSAVPRCAALPFEDAVEEAVRMMVAAHSVDPKLHKVLIERIPRIGRLERAEVLEREMSGLIRAYLEARRQEIGVRDLDLATFIVYGIVESLTHAAVLTRPELLGPAFVREVTAVTSGICAARRRSEGGGRRHRRPAGTTATMAPSHTRRMTAKEVWTSIDTSHHAATRAIPTAVSSRCRARTWLEPRVDGLALPRV
jgi:AcrR family transcriptional regulator